MKVFDFYSAYYDLIYRGKDYAGEADYITELLRGQGLATGHLLEMGCGTGVHAYHLARLGYDVHGIDLAEKMVARANEKRETDYSDVRDRLRFETGNVGSYRAGRTFDAAISLFHVMSYQIENPQLDAAFATAAAHLRVGGLFLFDFWYGPAVLTDLPHRRVKELEDDTISLTRTAEPVLHPNENVVDVNYHVEVRNKQSGESSEIKETHRMRYLFLPELTGLAERHGFLVADTREWMSDAPLSFSSWNGVMVCRKL